MLTLPPLHLHISFSVGNVPIQLEGMSQAQLGRVYSLWSRLFVLQPNPTKDTGGVQLRLVAVAPPQRQGEVVYATGALEVRRSEKGFDLFCGASHLRISLLISEGLCFLDRTFFGHSPYEQREFFLLGLLMLLRPRGLFGLHACGLEHRGKGLLIVGQSGSGKTTTTLSLIRQGWRFLSDDAVLLSSSCQGVEALAFRKGFSCTQATLAHFPDLTDASEFGDPEGKRIITVSDSHGGGFTPSCTPSHIVFPKIVDASKSTLHPLPKIYSLVRLSQQSAGIMTDLQVSKGQLELLKTLTLQTKSFELRLGRDALKDPTRVDRLLGELG